MSSGLSLHFIFAGCRRVQVPGDIRQQQALLDSMTCFSPPENDKTHRLSLFGSYRIVAGPSGYS